MWEPAETNGLVEIIDHPIAGPRQSHFGRVATYKVTFSTHLTVPQSLP